MSDWYWKVIALKAAFVLTCIVSSYRAEDTVQQLPFCNPHNVNTDKNDLMIVSTLDGKLTAFATESGDKLWEVETQPLLSSNLHHVELTSGGKWVRLVPSLRGTLYSLSGDNIEPLPFDADQLLSSSFKYSDDLVVAGAKETLWQGIDTATGSVLYSCGSGGCSSEQQAAGAGRRVLVLRRHGNTVRALDPRSGQEKWNFSVAEHHLALSSSPECLGPAGGGAGAVDVRVAVPEGTVAVARDSGLWRAQMEAPIAGMWRLEDGALKTIDVLWECTRALTDDAAPPPSLYIGVHRTQLYIQESQLYAQKLETSVSTQPLPWKLIQTRPLIEGGETALSVQESPNNALSLITLYGANGQTSNHGFFLYLQETCDQSVQVSEDLPPPSDGDHHHIHVHVYSLWFWWKEVLLIAVSSALLMNLMIWPRFFATKVRASTPLPSNHQEYIVVERHYDRPPSNPGQYCGRYESDFTPLRCLGRGGFGVVFEARNNIDHRSYAVKRITLPSRESKRERVLREVRALAKLEHEHIVRYFNSWVEEPPANWQDQRDAIWKRELNVSLDMSEEYTVESPTPIKTPISNSVKLNLDKCVDALDYEKQLNASKRNRSLSCNESFSIVFDENPKSNDDSFIVFANESTKAQTSSKSPSDAPKGPSNGPSDASKGPFDASKGPSNGPSDAFKGPTDGFKGPSDKSKGPSDLSKGLSEARKDSSLDKRLERVKECDSYVKNEATSTPKKKKGHTRHWSLDMVVRREETPLATKMYLYIQMQLCRRDSLHDWLRQNRTRASRGDKVKTLFSQIVSAVEYVHLEGLIHRDLKPSNIFFAPDGRVKVGDFGLVTTMGDNSQDGVPDMDAHERHTYKVGTHLYMSPEQLAGRPYSYKVDIYSLGVILFELLQPFDTESERVAKLTGLRADKYPGQFQEQCPKETEVLKLMLSEDPAKRPTASGVRARAPLYQPTEEKYHFNLPTPVSA